jgi:hypothetical protein
MTIRGRGRQWNFVVEFPTCNSYSHGGIKCKVAVPYMDTFLSAPTSMKQAISTGQLANPDHAFSHLPLNRHADSCLVRVG